eukprot:8165785-Ditylum_brightwellii.AAC.2
MEKSGNYASFRKSDDLFLVIRSDRRISDSLIPSTTEQDEHLNKMQEYFQEMGKTNLSGVHIDDNL